MTQRQATLQSSASPTLECFLHISLALVLMAKGITVGMSCDGWHVMQIAGDSEVKAQIKLRINTATSQPVVIIRSFQVRLQLQHLLKMRLNSCQVPWLL